MGVERNGKHTDQLGGYYSSNLGSSKAAHPQVFLFPCLCPFPSNIIRTHLALKFIFDKFINMLQGGSQEEKIRKEVYRKLFKLVHITILANE